MIENEEFALEFTKWLLNGRKVTKCTSPDNCEEYRPKEYDLLLGEIIQNGNSLIRDFWEYKAQEASFNIEVKKEKFYKEIYNKMMDDFIVYGEVVVPSDVVEKFKEAQENNDI